MVDTINIGSLPDKLGQSQAQYLLEELQDVGISCQISNYSDAQSLENALLSGAIQAISRPLNYLPTNQSNGIVTTAVSVRDFPAFWLIIRKGISTNKLFRLPDAAKVGVTSPLQKTQLHHYRPDIEILDLTGTLIEQLQRLQSSTYDAILVEAASINWQGVELNEFDLVMLHPKEFVPAPGQGVLAFQTRKEDISTRRNLKLVHQSLVSAETNVERKVLQLLGGDPSMALGVYCERDQLGNYHVWAVFASSSEGPIKRHHLSSSTSHQIAEKIASALQS